MDSEEQDAITALFRLLLGNTVTLTRIDRAGRGSGFVVPWRNEYRLITARHVLAKGDWAVEAMLPSRLVNPVTEQSVRSIPYDERKTLLLKLRPDTRSFEADPHDIAFGLFDFDRESLKSAEEILPLYQGPLDRHPTTDEPYAFAAANRDEHHIEMRAVVRCVTREAYMRYLSTDDRGLRFSLARHHQGDTYYRGASGAPIADPSGAIVAIVAGPGDGPDELRGAGVARFVQTMRSCLQGKS